MSVEASMCPAGMTRRGGPAIVGHLLSAVIACLLVWGGGDPARAEAAVVYAAPIEGMIDLGLAPFVERVLAEAAEAKSEAVVLEINTFGGRVDAAVVIRDALLRARVPTIAFVNKRAISAGALISLAAEKIVMAEGGTIGAATPVQVGGAETKPADEKSISYMRKEFRATAEARKRPLLVAEAMVDPDVAIPGVIDKGKLLTLTTVEALTLRVADVRADSLEAVLEYLKLPGAEVRRPSVNWAEQLVRFFTHPVLSSALITIGILGIIVELRTPGFGVPGAVGIASLGLFFWGHWLVRLAGWEEILLVALGVVLLALEVFVIPGFGITGVLGLLALLGGLTLSLVGAGATGAGVLHAVGRVSLSLLLAIAASLALLQFLPRLPYGRRLVLDTGLAARAGYASAPESDVTWVGKRGTAASPLRPAGIADLEGERVDVVSQGEYIETETPIEVVRVDGNRIVVRRALGGRDKG
jgi:membrane-bound serine protease (ClpP class)